jgi:hypothetical protein
MSSRQAVILASRVICVFLLYFACADLSYLPAHIFDTVHHWHALSGGSNPEWDRYWLRYYSLELEALVTRLVIEVFFAGVFYHCSDRIARFLLGGNAASSPAFDPTT